jgi:Transcription termination factor nusG
VTDGLQDPNADSTTEAGARVLAWRIESYWRGRGYAGIATRVEEVLGVSTTYRARAFCVRSNLGPDGFPPGGRGELMWVCAQTEPQREEVAVRHLGLAGFSDVYWPRVLERRRFQGYLLAIAASLFPNYLFLRLADGRWHAARKCIGVAIFIMGTGGRAGAGDR